MTGEAWRRRAMGLLVGVLVTFGVPLAAEAQQAPRLPPAVAAAANPVNDGQALLKQGKFPEALAKFAEAQGTAAAIPQASLRVFYQVTARLGSAIALDGMQRHDAALEHADWANQTVGGPQAAALPAALKAAVHHARGVILYHLKQPGPALAMFTQAAKEGDKTAATWQTVLVTPAVPTRAADFVELGDKAARGGKFDEALLLYVLALRQFDELGGKTALVMQRTLDVALRLTPPPSVPKNAGERLAAVDATLREGTAADLEAARGLLHLSLVDVPWWSDGWLRLGSVEEKLGNLAAARGALRLYLKAAPQATDRSAIEQRIADLNQRIAAGAAAAATAAAQPAVSDISGNWSTTEGRIIAVKQNGNQVSWTACCKPGHEDLVVSVTGTFDGRTLNGTYNYREGAAEGSGPATYTLSGDRLEGGWTTSDGQTFITALIRHPGDTPNKLGGKWTTALGRTLTLTQTGNQVRWTTCCRQAHPNWTADISATFDGKNLVGTYRWRDGDKQGNGTVSYVLNGNQLEGELNAPGKEPYRSVLTQRADISLSGKWVTETGEIITLAQKGNDVSGTECCRPGQPSWNGDVSGAFDGKNFAGVFRHRDGDASSVGTFIYVLNGSRLEGSFKPAGGDETKAVLTRQ